MTASRPRWQIRVAPTAPTGAGLYARGAGLSVATVGQPTGFMVLVRDAFGNEPAAEVPPPPPPSY